MGFIFCGHTGEIPKGAKKVSEENFTSEFNKAQADLILKSKNAVLSGKKYDIVISEDPDYKYWQQNTKKFNNGIGHGALLKNGAKGYPVYIAGKTGYFDPNDTCSECFDRPELQEDLKNFDGATQGDIDYLNGWMVLNNIDYEMEGYVGCYQVSTKAELIKLLKSCAIIGDIYEVDDQGKLVAKY